MNSHTLPGVEDRSWRRTGTLLVHLNGLAVGAFAFALVVADNRPLIFLLYLAFAFVMTMFAIELMVSGGRMSFPWILRAYGTFAVYAVISILWSRDPELAMGRGVTIASTAVALPMVAHLLRYPIVLRYVLVFLALATGVVAGILFAVVPAPGDAWSESGRFQGTFVLATGMARALFLAATAAFLIFFIDPSRITRRLAVTVLALAFLLTVPTLSRAGLAAVGVLIVGLLLTSGRLAIYVVSVGAIALGGLALSYQADLLGTVTSSAVERALPLITLDIERGTSADLRRAIVLEALRTFAENPVFGAGLTTLESMEGAYAHNAWADIAANLGLVGLGLWVGIYVLLLRGIWLVAEPRLRRAGYAVMLAILLYELADAFYLSRTGMLGMLLLYVVMKHAPSRNVVPVP
jgi:O-antigen ligase